MPEVETIKRDLERLLIRKGVSLPAGSRHRSTKGVRHRLRKIRSVKVKDPFVLTGISPKGAPRRNVSVSEFEKNVTGKEIRGVSRRGKYLVMEFSGSAGLLFHLRMTGQLTVSEPMGKERLLLFLDDGMTLCFTDRRRFGEVFFSDDWRNEPEIISLGVEPLNGKLDASYLKRHLRDRKAPIHSMLLNQKIVAGLGNIYVTESLFHSGILPVRAAGKISEERLEKLVRAIRWVLQRSISNRGYSMTTYVDALGRKGRSQLFTAVYGKENLPCAACGTRLKRKVISERSAVYCPACQR